MTDPVRDANAMLTAYKTALHHVVEAVVKAGESDDAAWDVTYRAEAELRDHLRALEARASGLEETYGHMSERNRQLLSEKLEAEARLAEAMFAQEERVRALEAEVERLDRTAASWMADAGHAKEQKDVAEARIAEAERHQHGNTDAHCDYCGYPPQHDPNDPAGRGSGGPSDGSPTPASTVRHVPTAANPGRVLSCKHPVHYDEVFGAGCDFRNCGNYIQRSKRRGSAETSECGDR